jgi:tetratricopeptide (TPR) repeat protein
MLAALVLAGCTGSGRLPKAARAAPATTGSKPALERGAERRGTEDRSEAALKRRSAAYAHFAAGMAFDLNGEGEKAEKEFWEAAVADPGNERLALDLARRLLQRQRTDKAVELLTRCAARAEASGLVHAWLGLVQAQAGHADQALAASRVAVKKAPRLFLGYQTQAQVHLGKKQPKEALRVLDEAARQADASVEFLVELAELVAGAVGTKTLSLEEAKPRAQAALERAAKLRPQQPLLLQRMAESYKAIGELGKATDYYQELLKGRLPANPALRPLLREQLLQLYLRSGDKTRAAEQLREILRENPASPQVHYLLGSLAAEDKEYTAAKSHFDQALSLAPDFEPAYHELAGVLIMDNKPKPALETLDKAREKFAPNFVVEYYAGLAQAALKNFPAAVRSYTLAEVLGRTTDDSRLNHTFYFQIGAACERKGDYAEAEKHFRKCLQLSADFAEALNYLGYMWAERGVNLEEAKAMIERAVRLEPNNAAFLDSMGWVLFKLKRPQDALRYQQQAIDSAEKPDATLFDHLGDIQAALGWSERARDAWRKALELEPSDELKKKLEASPASKPAL